MPFSTLCGHVTGAMRPSPRRVERCRCRVLLLVAVAVGEESRRAAMRAAVTLLPMLWTAIRKRLTYRTAS